MLGGGKALGLCPPGFEDSDMAVIEAGTDLTTMHETDPRKILGAAPAGARNVASSIAAPGGLGSDQGREVIASR